MSAMNSTHSAMQAALRDVAEAQDLTGFLARVEDSLGKCLVDAPEADGGRDTLMGAARHLCMGGGGKRARPLLTRLFGQVVGADEEALVEVGASAELIHSASLLHDDVVDAGMFRRGRPTVNALWGNIVAVMTGDLVLSTALAKLARLDARVTEQAIALVAEMTRAAIAEVESRGDVQVGIDRLRFIAEGKTGALFGFCGLAAATLAGSAEGTERFAAFGRRLGIAFQMADDIRDVAGTDEGKPQFADIESRTPSLPVLLAAAQDESFKRKLKEAWAFSAMTPERVRELGALVASSPPVMQAAVQQVEEEVKAAIEALGSFRDSLPGAALVDWACRLAEGVGGKVRG
jgi:octaprenyl-diphosphate synthase